jgi:hypothetical protein
LNSATAGRIPYNANATISLGSWLARPNPRCNDDLEAKMNSVTPDLLRAINEAGGEPLRLTDPHTNTEYVVLRAEVFDRVKHLLQNGDLADTYSAQIESAMRAGWDDPLMDEYNHYDGHKPS